MERKNLNTPEFVKLFADKLKKEKALFTLFKQYEFNGTYSILSYYWEQAVGMWGRELTANSLTAYLPENFLESFNLCVKHKWYHNVIGMVEDDRAEKLREATLTIEDKLAHKLKTMMLNFSELSGVYLSFNHEKLPLYIQAGVTTCNPNEEKGLMNIIAKADVRGKNFKFTKALHEAINEYKEV